MYAPAQTGKGWLAGDTFAERLNNLKGDASFRDLAAKMQKAGYSVTAQGIYKWCNGGGISPGNLLDVARFFGVSPAHLFFGGAATADDDLTPEAKLVGKAWSLVPDRFRPDLTRDILRIASAYADKEGPAFRASLKAMLDSM